MARVLVVDDEPVMRELIEATLEDAGHAVESVESGRAALELLAQHAYDLIVCDLHMTDRDGPAVYRAIERRAPPRPAFLFVTGYAEARITLLSMAGAARRAVSEAIRARAKTSTGAVSRRQLQLGDRAPLGTNSCPRPLSIGNSLRS